MGLQTHIGPQLLGTVKNNNPSVVTSSSPTAGGLGTSTGTFSSGALSTGVPTGTVWPPFLGTGQTNGIRNLGVGDGTQFGSFIIQPYSGNSTAFSTGQTGVTVPFLTNTNTGTTATTYAFYPGVYTTGPTGQQQFQPMVMPAGTYVAAVVFDITALASISSVTQGVTTSTGTAFAAGTTCTSSAVLSLYAVGAPGTTYATPQLICQHSGSGGTGASSVTSAWNSLQRNQVGSGSGLSIPANATPYLVNTGNTDTILMCVISLLLGTNTGGSPSASIGLGGVSGYIGINYTIRNPDGSWYPQTPTSPIANPPVITY